MVSCQSEPGDKTLIVLQHKYETFCKMSKTVLLNGFLSINWEGYEPGESIKGKGEASQAANDL